MFTGVVERCVVWYLALAWHGSVGLGLGGRLGLIGIGQRTSIHYSYGPHRPSTRNLTPVVWNWIGMELKSNLFGTWKQGVNVSELRERTQIFCSITDH